MNFKSNKTHPYSTFASIVLPGLLSPLATVFYLHLSWSCNMHIPVQ